MGLGNLSRYACCLMLLQPLVLQARPFTMVWLARLYPTSSSVSSAVQSKISKSKITSIIQSIHSPIHSPVQSPGFVPTFSSCRCSCWPSCEIKSGSGLGTRLQNWLDVCELTIFNTLQLFTQISHRTIPLALLLLSFCRFFPLVDLSPFSSTCDKLFS